MTARQMRPDDQIPFGHGLEGLTIDTNWGWVVEDKGTIVGMLLLAPVHGAVMIVRLVGCEQAPKHWVRKILTQASKDVLGRGYKVAYVYLNLDRPLEARLTKLIMAFAKEGHRGIMAANHALCVTRVEDWV